MSEAPSIPRPNGKIGALLRKRVLGIPVGLLAAVAVTALALYAWKTKSIPEPVEEEEVIDGEIDGVTYNDDENANPSLFPISPTGTVYAQAPSQVVEDAPDFDNNAWVAKAVMGMAGKGKNPGEVQQALQAYIEGEHLTYAQSVIRDQALKDYGYPPDSFRAGTSDAKPVPKPTPAPAPKPTPAPVVKPVTKPKPAPPKPVAKPKPKPKRTHRVVRGDTLWDLSQKYYRDPTQWRKIASANGVRNPRTLQIGKVLVIP